MNPLSSPANLPLPTVMVPILPWQNTKLLSQAVGDTVYAKTAFATAVRLLIQLGVPETKGAIGVPIAQGDPYAMGEAFWKDNAAENLGAALRAKTKSLEVLSDSQRFDTLIQILADSGWYGLEIEAREENLDSKLCTYASRATDAGLHVTLSILPGALHAQNQHVMDAFEVIALDLVDSKMTRHDKLKYLTNTRVVGKVVDANSTQRTNLEAALQTLVLLRAALDIEVALAVGIAGDFQAATLALDLREDISFVERTGRASAKQKIFEAVDLAAALSDGKTSVAEAFAADQVSRAGRLTSRPVSL